MDSFPWLTLKLAILVALCILPGIGITHAWLEAGQWWWLVPYVIMSLVVAVMYGYDKSQARDNEWRIPEVWLQGLALVGGWPGALVAQHLFRHKNRKVPFQLVFWAIVALHQVLWFIYDHDILASYLHEISASPSKN